MGGQPRDIVRGGQLKKDPVYTTWKQFKVQIISIFEKTRSYAALRAADLDWIVGPGYSSGRYILEKNHEKPTWNVTNAGSQLTWEGGRAGISKNVTDTSSMAKAELNQIGWLCNFSLIQKM